MHLLCRGRVSGPSSAQRQHHSWQVSAPLLSVGTFSDGETTAFLVFSSVSLYSFSKAFHFLWSNFSLLLLSNFLLDLTTLLWLPFWSIHLTACLGSTPAHTVQLSLTDGFERRPSSRTVQNYLVFPHWDTCPYKTYFLSATRYSWVFSPLPQNTWQPDNSQMWLCKGGFLLCNAEFCIWPVKGESGYLIFLKKFLFYTLTYMQPPLASHITSKSPFFSISQIVTENVKCYQTWHRPQTTAWASLQPVRWDHGTENCSPAMISQTL